MPVDPAIDLTIACQFPKFAGYGLPSMRQPIQLLAHDGVNLLEVHGENLLAGVAVFSNPAQQSDSMIAGRRIWPRRRLSIE